MPILRQRIFIVKELWPYFREFRIQLLLIFLVKLSLLIPNLAYPIVYKYFIDTVLVGQTIGLIGPTIIFFLGLYILETVLKVIHRVFDNFLFNNISYSLKQAIFQKYMYMPLKKYGAFIVSDLKNRIDTDVDMVKIFILNQIFAYIIAFAKLISSSVILLFFDWRIGIFSIAMLPFSILISNSFNKTLAKKYEDIKKQDNFLEQTIQESIHYWKEIKVNNLVEWICSKYKRSLNEKYEYSRVVTDVLIKRNIIINIKDTWMNQMLIYILGAILFLMDQITMGIVVMGGQYYNNMYGSLNEMLKLNVELERVKPSINRVQEIMSIEIDSILEDFEMFSRITKHSIVQIKNLSFKYETSSQYVFENLNFSVYAGDKILILGESGTGKSTLIGLLSGCLNPTDGEISFWGQEISTLSQHDLYSKMAIIYQEPYFMNLSIKEFLLLANQEADMERLRNVCNRVGMIDLIEQLPEKFDTKLGERGGNFSGGQKQRLALARLLLSNKEIIILDEAFSAIDGHGKALILQEIMNEFYDKIVICISHDEGVADFFDQKLKLVKGVLVDG